MTEESITDLPQHDLLRQQRAALELLLGDGTTHVGMILLREALRVPRSGRLDAPTDARLRSSCARLLRQMPWTLPALHRLGQQSAEWRGAIPAILREAGLPKEAIHG